MVDAKLAEVRWDFVTMQSYDQVGSEVNQCVRVNDTSLRLNDGFDLLLDYVAILINELAINFASDKVEFSVILVEVFHLNGKRGHLVFKDLRKVAGER